MTSRLFSDPADLQAMIELTQALRHAGQKVYPIAADLYEELADPDVQACTRLWEGQDHKLAGFVYVNKYENLVDVFDATQLTPAIEKEMLEWAVSMVRLRNHENGTHLTLDAGTLDNDLPRLAFLQRHGFKPHPNSSILMSRSLDQPIPEAQLPPGFTIRAMGGEAEIEAYVALHRAAFGTGNMNVDYRRAIMNVPSYIPELDLVAVAPDGELAAFCVCQIFPDDVVRGGGQKEGWTDPVGTHPSYQRMGLSRALILTGMRLLKKRGIDTALMGTSSENYAMQRVASAVGFHTISNTLWYCKDVEAQT